MMGLAWLGRAFAVAGTVAGAVTLVAACSGKTEDTAASACERYMQASLANTERCGGAAPTQEGRAHFVSRGTGMCTRTLALPGQGMTPATLDACGTAMGSAPCTGPTPEACKSPAGALADGASCSQSSQCKSRRCGLSMTPPPPGTSDAGADAGQPACRTCIAVPDEGEACTGMCAEGTTCTAGFCKRYATLRVGEACDGSSNVCGVGLYCNPRTRTCDEPRAAGGACAGPWDCAAPLRCSMGKCGTGLAEGAACKDALECSAGLVCAGTSARTCTRRRSAKPGEPCDGVVIACEVGACSNRSSSSSSSSGTCPTILADGAACDSKDRTATCDHFADCAGGTCQLDALTSCR